MFCRFCTESIISVNVYFIEHKEMCAEQETCAPTSAQAVFVHSQYGRLPFLMLTLFDMEGYNCQGVFQKFILSRSSFNTVSVSGIFMFFKLHYYVSVNAESMGFCGVKLFQLFTKSFDHGKTGYCSCILKTKSS